MVCKFKYYSAILFLILFPLHFYGMTLTIYKNEGFYGLLDENLNVIINAEYKICITSNDKKYFCLNKKNESKKCIIIDNNGQLCWEGTKNDYVESIFGEFFFDIRQDAESIEFILINAKNHSEKRLKDVHEIFPVRNTAESPNSFAIRNDFKGVIYDLDFKLKIHEKKLAEIGNPLVFPEIGGAMAYGRGSGILNTNGEVVLKNLIDCGFNFTQGLMPVITDTKKGFIDNKGNFIFLCPIYYEQSGGGSCPGLNCNFSEGYAYVPSDQYMGTIYNLTGDIIKDHLPYISNGVYSDGWICVYDKKGKFNFLSYHGNKITESDFDYAEPFINGYAIISISGNDALIDKNGKIFQIKSIVHQFE